jgi:hypothetical protein
MKMLPLFMAFLMAIGCSSTSKDNQRELEEREHSKIKREYTVVDASSNTRPGWIEDAEVWAFQNREDVELFRYFSFETDPKVSRQIACELARANARGDIAGEISTFISRSLADTTEGSANIDPNNPEVKALRNYVDTTLTEKVTALIHGSSVLKTYWEKRNYAEKLGAKGDYSAFTCAVYVQMSRERLASAIDRASTLVSEEVENQDLRDKVEQALANANQDFERMRRGQL